MRFIQADKIEKIINRLSVLTMEGEVFWSSVDVLDIQSEIADKDNLLSALVQSQMAVRDRIKKDIEFLALKEYSEERINQAISRKEAKLQELNKRISFARKTRQRLVNRLERFDLSLSRGWYIDFRLEEKTQRSREYPLRLIIRKRDIGDEITYEGGITYVVKSDTVAIDNFVDSSKYPVIYTLGILLKKEGRVTRTPKQVYKINLSGV